MLSGVKNALQLPTAYPEFLQALKTRIRGAQIRAAFAVNRELILLYWSVGRDILVRQHAEGWGSKVIDRLAKDLQTEFPGVEGFSPRSLKYIRSFAEAWTEEPIVQQLVAQLRSRRWLHGRRQTMTTPTTALVHLEQRTADRAFAAAGSVSDAQAQIAGLRRDGEETLALGS
jgi:hypothetical protein